MLRGLSLLGLGAGLMYLLDPDRGTSRRALIRDKAIGRADSAADGLEVATRDLSHRAVGLVSELRSRLTPDVVTDDLLVERVRSKLGRWVSHPRAIAVEATNGLVILRGPILRQEVEPLLGALHTVPGVREIANELELHASAENVPSLQGGMPRHEVSELAQARWTPALRLMVGAGGALIALYGLGRRDVLGSLMRLTGAGLVARATTDFPVSRLVGLDGGRRGIVVQKTVTLAMPIERVYDLWNHPEQFPCFMQHIQEVRPQGADRYHWVVKGPAGLPVEWDAVVTKREPNRLIAWKSVEGQAIENAGLIHFEPTADGGTRLNIRMTYHPPAGVLGHAVASFFGADPKHEMDVDFVQVKQLLEQGATT